MTRTWFQDKSFVKLELIKFKSISNHDVECTVLINDLKVIVDFVNRIERIPVDGDMMKSFGGEAEHVKLMFVKEDSTKEEINIYQKRFKTPSTGFNSLDVEVEKDLYMDIDALLFPAVEKKTLKVENLELNFSDFSIEYKGAEYRDLAPVSLSFTTDVFIVKCENLRPKRVEIASGQLPPQPFDLKMKDGSFKIFTYKTEDSIRLYPNYFRVIRSN